MHVLRNHFDGNATVLIKDRIINGCQDFTMDQADEVIEQYKVPSRQWQQVLDVYTGTSTDEEMLAFVNDEDMTVRCKLARHGSEAVQLQLVGDGDVVVRCELAEHGSEAVQLQLVGEKAAGVRYALARHGSEAVQLQLVGDEGVTLRRLLREHGSEKVKAALKAGDK